MASSRTSLIGSCGPWAGARAGSSGLGMCRARCARDRSRPWAAEVDVALLVWGAFLVGILAEFAIDLLASRCSRHRSGRGRDLVTGFGGRGLGDDLQLLRCAWEVSAPSALLRCPLSATFPGRFHCCGFAPHCQFCVDPPHLHRLPNLDGLQDAHAAQWPHRPIQE